MCGITGILRFKEAVGQEEIERMTAVLSRRGPDGAGTWLEGGVAIGHRRLSIIDLETGRQPMCNEDGTVWITYNGELYNFLELRQELISTGHTFRTHSDTEVIIHAYEEWGDDCVCRFRGMFAFAIVDKRQQRLFIARDQLGIKPLVYYAADGIFAFASEIQALRQIRGVKLDLDLQSLDHYLFLQYIPAPRTVFQQMQKLPPAHRMSVTFAGKIEEPRQYWSIAFTPDNTKSEAEWLEELDQVLRDSVKAHLVADVPFGAFLSGGVDSSAVVAYMAQILDRPVKTFSIGFEEDEYNELEFAEIAAKRWGTEHHVEIVKPDALAILPDLVRCYGEPFGDSSAIPSYYVAKMARQHVPMVLSGDGGDETFAGYNSHLAWMEWTSNSYPLWKRCLWPIARKLFPHRYGWQPTPGPSLHNWLGIMQYMATATRQALWRPEHLGVVTADVEAYSEAYAMTKGYSLAHTVQYLDMKTYLPFDILTKVDVVSMMNSLEVRTPIVDVRVAEFAATIPEQFNIRKNAAGKWQGKLLLKRLMERYYPAEFLHRRKMGFGVPIQKWFAPAGSLHNDLHERLLSRNSLICEYFEPKTIRQLVANNDSRLVWLLLFLEEWLQGRKC